MTCRWSDRNLPGRVLPQCPGPGSPSSGQGRPAPWAALRGICAAGVTGPGTGAPPAPPAPALRLRLPSSRGSSSGSSAQKRQQGCRSRERPSACFLQRCQFGLRKLITVVHRAGCSLPRQHVLGRPALGPMSHPSARPPPLIQQRRPCWPPAPAPGLPPGKRGALVAGCGRSQPGETSERGLSVCAASVSVDFRLLTFLRAVCPCGLPAPVIFSVVCEARGP